MWFCVNLGNTIQPEDVIFFKTNRYPVENLT